jgi:hypothetical protein
MLIVGLIRYWFVGRCGMRSWATMLLFLLTTLQCWPATSPMLQEVAPGAYVALQPFADRFNDSNSTVIVLDDSVVVVDTQTTLTTTREVLEQIRKVTGKPVRWVINTHWHGDHVLGNQVYREAFRGVQFIAHLNTREDMASRTTAELKEDIANIPGQIEKYRQMLASGHDSDGEALTQPQVKHDSRVLPRASATIGSPFRSQSGFDQFPLDIAEFPSSSHPSSAYFPTHCK